MLKIIAGSRRGTKLFTLEGLATRPLRGRVRESLFNILQSEIPQARVLDLYAGSGAVGLEAVSRGAVHATFVEAASEAVRVIQRNVAKLRFEDTTDIVPGRLPACLRTVRPPAGGYSLVFIMPPYELGIVHDTLKGLRTHQLLAKDALVVLEVESKCLEGKNVDFGPDWSVTDDRSYGVTRLFFLKRAVQAGV